MTDSSQIVSVVAIGVVALVGLLVMGTLGGVAVNFGIADQTHSIDEPQTGETYEFDLDDPDTFEVKATQEFAIDPEGDGHVEISDTEALADGDWTVKATSAVNGSTAATYNLLAYNDEEILVEYSDGEYRAMHYTGDQSALATVTASEPTDLTPIAVSWDATAEELTLATPDGTDTALLSAEDPDRELALDWNGAVDEIRVFDEHRDVATSAYLDDPIQPLDGEQTVRVMFNEGSGDTTVNYYGAEDATIVDATWTDGVENPELVEGEDFDTTTEPTTVTFLAGGYFEGAPVAFVELESLGPLAAVIDSILSGFGSAMGLIPVVMIVILSAVIISVVQRTRGV